MLDAALFGLPKLKMKVQGDPENIGHIFPKRGDIGDMFVPHVFVLE